VFVELPVTRQFALFSADRLALARVFLELFSGFPTLDGVLSLLETALAGLTRFLVAPVLLPFSCDGPGWFLPGSLPVRGRLELFALLISGRRELATLSSPRRLELATLLGRRRLELATLLGRRRLEVPALLVVGGLELLTLRVSGRLELTALLVVGGLERDALLIATGPTAGLLP
jgi:hypothetical protein